MTSLLPTLSHRAKNIMRLPFLFCISSCVFALGCQSKAGSDYQFDFLDSQFDEDQFRLLGSKGIKPWEFIHREAEGLRMMLPQGSDAQMVGFATRHPIQGDFEITAEYALIQCGLPESGYGVGASLYVNTRSNDERAAILSRLRRPVEGDVYNAYVGRTLQSGKRKHDSNFTETSTTDGAFRMVRENGTLSFLVADSDPLVFRVIRQVDFGDEDVSVVRFGIDRGGVDVALEVIWKNATISTQPKSK